MKHFPLSRVNRFIPTLYDDSRSLFDRFKEDFESVFSDDRAIGEDGTIVYSIEVPGFSNSDISVELSDGILNIQGRIKNKTIGGVNLGDREFYKRMTVSKAENVDPILENGVLYIVIKPIKKESVKLDVK